MHSLSNFWKKNKFLDWFWGSILGWFNCLFLCFLASILFSLLQRVCMYACFSIWDLATPFKIMKNTAPETVWKNESVRRKAWMNFVCFSWLFFVIFFNVYLLLACLMICMLVWHSKTVQFWTFGKYQFCWKIWMNPDFWKISVLDRFRGTILSRFSCLFSCFLDPILFRFLHRITLHFWLVV